MKRRHCSHGFFLDGVTNDGVPPLERSYKSKTLAYYPAHVPWNPFDSYGTCMLSLPQGLKFRTQKHDTKPRFHSFASTRDDGKRCYGFSLVFYEETKNENICTAMQTLQSMFITELSSKQGSLKRQDSISKSLPRHFRIGDDDKNGSASSFYDIQKDTLLVTKSITLICQCPYAHVAEVFLTNLYKCLPRAPGARLSLESYIYNILYDIKVPDYGKSIRIYLPPEAPNLTPINTILQRPKITELPLLDFPLRLLFSFLGVGRLIPRLRPCNNDSNSSCSSPFQNVCWSFSPVCFWVSREMSLLYQLTLIVRFLLENQVLLKSEDFQKLTIVAECITSLLFPFEWPHVYAPILPTALHHFLDAPVPFVMGLHSQNLDASVQQKVGLCYVDIDNKTIQLPEELPTFPHKPDFIAEIYEALSKFRQSEKVELPMPTNEFESTILNPKNLMMNNNFYFQSPTSNDKYSNIQYQRLSASPAPSATLTLNKSRRKKHSLHDFISNFDYSGPSNEHQGSSANTVTSNKPSTNSPTTNEQYYNDLRLNFEIREIFLNRFCHIFLDYQSFLILPNQNKSEWLKNRESMHNFDKASFLSDQSAQYRPFLSQFLESQMFATLIDNKIMTSFDDKPSGSSSDPKVPDEDFSSFDVHVNKNLQLLDNRIKILKLVEKNSEKC
jgi:DENN domain-containing protein 5